MAGAQTRKISVYWLVVAAIVLLGVALRIALYDPWGQYHADEWLQYLEQGNRLAAGYGLVPWESRYGLRNALIPQFLSLPLWLGDRIAPTAMLSIHLARAAYAALCLLALAGAWGLGAAKSRRHALVALFVAAVWYDSVFFSTTVLPGSAATALIVCGAALLPRYARGERHVKPAGFLLMLGVLIRVQYAPFVAVLLVWAVWRDWRTWRSLAIGGAIALVLAAVSDLADHRVPFAWIGTNLTLNLEEGRAADFGTAGPFEYAHLLWAGFGLTGVAICLASLFAGRRYWPLLAASWASIVVHSLIAHKEFRFIWLSLFVILVLAAIATVELVGLLLARRKAGPRGSWIGAALLCAGWAALALPSARSGPARLPRDGGIYPLTANLVSSHPEVCGLAVPEKFSIFVAQVFLRRNVPLYYIPADNVGGLSPLPPELSAGANAALNDGELLSNPEYRQVACRQRDGENLCLLIRPGPCDAKTGKDYDIQRNMIREDL